MTIPPTIDDEVIFLGTKEKAKDPAPSTPTREAPAVAPPKRIRRASAATLAGSVGVIVGRTASGKQVWGVLAGSRFLLLALPHRALIAVDEVTFKPKFRKCDLQQIKAKIKQQLKEQNTGEI